MSFPFFQQLDQMDCAPTCLQIISKYYKKNIDIEFLRKSCYISKEGVSLMDLSDTAESIGFLANPVTLDWNSLRENVQLPCILLWNKRHYVVLYKITNTKVYISDPAQGLLKYDKKPFLKFWSHTIDEDGDEIGIALLLEPTSLLFSTSKEIKKKLSLKDLSHYLKPYKKYIFQLIIGIITGILISAIFPFLTSSIVDIGINSKDINFIIIIFIAQFMFILGLAVNNFIRNWLLLHLNTRIGILLISNFLNKLMQLPISFFEQRMVGDTSQRIEDYDKIQKFMSETCLSILMSIIIFFVYSIFIAFYDIKLLLIFLGFTTMYVIWVMLFTKKRKRIEYIRLQEAAQNHNHIYQILNEIQEIKLNNYTKKKRWDWEKTQVKLFSLRLKGLSLMQKQEAGALIIDNSKNIIIMLMSAIAVIQNEMSLGTMMAIQYIIGQLNIPISQFISFNRAIQDAKISMDRLSDIQNKDNEESIEQLRSVYIPQKDIILNNVSFHYGSLHSPQVLSNINLLIPFGKITAIVGASGSGKTTLLKLLLKFYKPTQGSIYLGDKSLEDFSHTAWRKSVATVMQDGVLFSETIISNIITNDVNYNKERLDEAIRKANLEQIITTLPFGLKTKVGIDGQGVSTGQKQRILIARLIYKDANYLLLDEATNALDTINEKEILDNLSEYFKGRTVIIVAHRLSTVKDADNIVVLDKGKVIEEGKHEELVAKKGTYFNLIKNQLELGN